MLMRAFLAGISLLLLMSGAAFGQATGFVESVGFDRAYRPDCWVPMVVNLSSQIPEPATYDIQVEQEDLDGDTVVYARQQVTLNAGATDRYWVYFLPRPRGLPDSALKLGRSLRVNLYTPGGGKHVAQLPLPQGMTLINIDPRRGFGGGGGRGKKLVLAVVDPSAQGRAPWREYNVALGLIEDPELIYLRPVDLPESPLGYDAVDAVLWLTGKTQDLEAGGSRALAGLKQWVARGGQLVVVQPSQSSGSHRISGFEDVLPVHLTGDDGVRMREREEPQPLHRLAMEPFQSTLREGQDPWDRLPARLKFEVAYAKAKPGAVVDAWVEWTEDRPEPAAKTAGARAAAPEAPEAPPAPKTPYIARMAHGLGSVAWVGQDLTSANVASPVLYGWPHVWDRVFGWRNATIVPPAFNPEDSTDPQRRRYDANGVVDMGKSVLHGMDHEGKAGAYILLAVFFFVGYWVVAGPGSYVFLAGKGRRQLSWPMFAVAAIAATALTVGVVRLVLRGDPEVKHFSVVRMTPGQPAVVDSRIGLYIPRDGNQEVKLLNVAPDSISQVHALALHPQFVPEGDGYLDTGKYTIPVRDDNAEGTVVAEFPYRSTLKKIQAEWVGPLSNGVSAQGDGIRVVTPRPVQDVTGKTVGSTYVVGTLLNNTGADLQNVLVGFRYDPRQDWLLFVPRWGKGATLDLAHEFASATLLPDPAFRQADFSKPQKGFLGSQWGRFWHKNFNTGATGVAEMSDDKLAFRSFLGLMSVFDRIPPQPNEVNNFNRVELLRRGGRDLNLSQSLAAGQLVMMAEAPDTPLPFPMEVEGEQVTGEGTTYYQFVLPVDRSQGPKDIDDDVQQEPDAETEAAGEGTPGVGDIGVIGGDQPFGQQ